jgi:hypothetical protein
MCLIGLTSELAGPFKLFFSLLPDLVRFVLLKKIKLNYKNVFGSSTIRHGFS